MTTVYRLDPVQDPRWMEFVARHPRASTFHTPAWIAALEKTYGYVPVVYTTSRPRLELDNGLVFCRVKSRLTGRRLVSLPFSDHCEPLVENEDVLDRLLDAVEHDRRDEGGRYVEIRPKTAAAGVPRRLLPTQRFSFHSLSLDVNTTALFSHFAKDSVQRKIRKAARAGVSLVAGRNGHLLDAFFGLLVRTRRRKNLPPQPRVWFDNLRDAFGDDATIRLASYEGRAVASIMTLRTRDVTVYKYGASDERFHHLGAVQALFWDAIQHAARAGMHEFDLGRSDLDDAGLIRFKDQWGACRSTLTYWRYPAPGVGSFASRCTRRVPKNLFRHIPERVFTAAGRLLYRHVG